jgi:deoxyhypusine synthase
VVDEWVEQIVLAPELRVVPLLEAMDRTGVLGAGSLGKAFRVTVEMLEDSDYAVFLTLAGPVVPGGLRQIIQTLLDKHLIEGIVTSGANIVHYIIEALGYKAIKGSFQADDSALRNMGIGRAGDILFPQEAFTAFEKKTYDVLGNISEAGRKDISTSQLLAEYGNSLNDEGSFLRTAAKNEIPIFAPALLDSMLGFHIWTYSQLHSLRLDQVGDMTLLADIIYEAKKVGALILGGGASKHFLLGANTLRDGLDAAVQITLDRPEGGSLGGAPLEEAVSWKKAKSGRLVTVVGDATMVFPFLIAGALEKLGML